MKKLFLILLVAHCAFGEEAPCYPNYDGPKEFEVFATHLDFLVSLLPDAPVILEAGAHYGRDTIKFAKKWPSCEIYCFEPNPHAFEILSDATRGIPNIYRYPFALNTYNGETPFHICYGSTGKDPIFEGASSLLDPADFMKIHYQGPDIAVPCIILDDWCKQNEVSHFDLLWLDLEGMELPVLYSSPEILKTVKVIFTETNFRAFRIGMTRYRDLRNFLEKQGFKQLAHWYNPAIQGNAIFVR